MAQINVPATGPLASLVDALLASRPHGSRPPVQANGPQCNTRGITPLGTYVVINQMIKDHFHFQLGPHGQLPPPPRRLAIAMATTTRGSSRPCSAAPRRSCSRGIYATGGFISPPAEPAPAFVATWQDDKAQRRSQAP